MVSADWFRRPYSSRRFALLSSFCEHRRMLMNLSQLLQLGRRTLSIALANLIGRAGRPLFHSYCEKVLGRPPPALPEDSDLRRYGAVVESVIRRDFELSDYLKIWRDLQRIHDLSARNGKDCLRFAALQLQAEIGDLRRSAFQEALFFCLQHREIFVAAEAISARGRWGQSDKFCDVFLLDELCRPERFATLIAPFQSAVRLMLERLTGDPVHLEVDPITMPPLLPVGAKDQLHVQITWGDSSEPIAILGEHGPDLINPPVQRVAGLWLGPDGRTVTIFGVKLRNEGREKLVRLFGDLLSSHRAEPAPLPRLGFSLHRFANPRKLLFPPQADIHCFCVESIQYIPPGCSNAIIQQVTYPLTPWDSIASERGEAYARGELSGACVLSVRFRIDLKVSKLFPEGRTIRGSVTRNGYLVDTGLDVDRYVAEACFTHLGIYQRPGDLLRGVG